MINRRHIRVKVMQSVYAMITSKTDDLIREEKFLKHSNQKLLDLYVLQLQLLLEVQKRAVTKIEVSKNKHLATKKELNPNTKFINNKALENLAKSQSLAMYIADNNLENWKEDNEYVKIIWNKLQDSFIYKKYMDSDDNSFKSDREFVIDFFKEIIAPENKLYEYYEDKMISWSDDIPFVNTCVIGVLKRIKKDNLFILGQLYKDADDEKFVLELFRKVMLHHKTFEKDIGSKTPNWDTGRIAEIDMILIKMAICEFLKFPSIPVRVTINEYIEIAKNYSTENSSYFINGVLDKLSKDFSKEKRFTKVGRGLL